MLEEITLKLTTLLCILSGQRAQAIAKLSLSHMHQDETSFTFYIPTVLKTSTPTFHQRPLVFNRYPHSEKLCIWSCLKEYLNRTELIRDNVEEGHRLILSYAAPNHPVKSATICRYVKSFLTKTGIDVTVFTAHSTRSASTSAANNMGLSVKDLAKAAGWRNGSTFQKFYKFPIMKNFGDTVLSAPR